MSDEQSAPKSEAKPQPGVHAEPGSAAPGKALAPAAMRALAEAAQRRAALDEKTTALAAAREIDGRGGLDPVRYNDWDVKGLAVDF